MFLENFISYIRGLLILRAKGNPPDKVSIVVESPGGEFSYSCPVICMSDYSVDDLFVQKLFFLLPFYIFNFENKLYGYESGEYDVQELEHTYIEIIDRIRDIDEKELSLRSKGVIIKQMERVAGRLTERTSVVHEKVGDIMGGKVVKMEWLERFDAAVAEGEARGEARGEAERKKLLEEIELLKKENERLKQAAAIV